MGIREGSPTGFAGRAAWFTACVFVMTSSAVLSPPKFASAQAPPPSGEAPLEGPAQGTAVTNQETSLELDEAQAEEGQLGYVGVELGLGQIDEDLYLSVAALLALRFDVPKAFCSGFLTREERAAGGESRCRSDLDLGLWLPLRLRLLDVGPQDEGVLRREDWDSASDFARVVRYAQYGRPVDPLYARVGELNGATIGHGTIMNRYFNVLTVDRYELGVDAALNANIGGAELVLDNVLEPRVIGTRLYGRPSRFAGSGSWWDRYAIGASLVMDTGAPLSFARVSPNEDVTQPLVVTADNRLEVAEGRLTAQIGLDQELLLIETEEVDFIPYLDINVHLGNSPGAYLGAMTNFRVREDFGIYTRLELRAFGENHIPVYFSALYEIEREAYFGFAGQGQPKLVVLEGLRRGGSVGALGEARFEVVDTVEVTAAFENYQGTDNASLWLRVALPRLGPVSAAAVYQNSGFDELTDALKLDTALLVFEGRYRINDYFYGVAQYNRLFRLQEEGNYETVNSWLLGAGAALGL